MTISDVSVTEGSSGTRVAEFYIDRSGTGGFTSVSWDTADGTATSSGGDCPMLQF